MLKLDKGLSVGAAVSHARVTPRGLKAGGHRAYIALNLLSWGS
jgi:hypothetical protein